MKRQSIFGIIYGAIWFSIITFIFSYDLGFPIIEWVKESTDAGVYSQENIILGFRSMWAAEFTLHVLLAAIPTAILISKYYPTATYLDLLKISVFCIIFMSIFIFTSTPKFVPFYIATSIQMGSYIVCLFGSFGVTKYITSR
ncbi:MAG: hypothetical protein GY823_12430 [Flavobacteriaceae bacterium]|nr:hypothetical protein [Flavobacteriaceae bacterium]